MLNQEFITLLYIRIIPNWMIRMSINTHILYFQITYSTFTHLVFQTQRINLIEASKAIEESKGLTSPILSSISCWGKGLCFYNWSSSLKYFFYMKELHQVNMVVYNMWYHTTILAFQCKKRMNLFILLLLIFFRRLWWQKSIMQDATEILAWYLVSDYICQGTMPKNMQCLFTKR